MATPPLENDESQQPMIFGRRAPDASRRLVPPRGRSVVIFLAALWLCWALAGRAGLPRGWALLVAPVAAFAITFAVARTIFAASETADAAMQLFTSAGSVLGEDQFSLEQAMVDRGEVEEALASFERRIAARGAGVDVRVRAAELYAREGRNPARAAELLRAARTLPELTEPQDVYVTSRLAELLAGPLDQHGRALVELRRLVERYPGTPAAAHARSALSALRWRAVREG